MSEYRPRLEGVVVVRAADTTVVATFDRALAERFPGVAFLVSADERHDVTIRWTDGPSVPTVGVARTWGGSASAASYEPDDPFLVRIAEGIDAVLEIPGNVWLERSYGVATLQASLEEVARDYEIAVDPGALVRSRVRGNPGLHYALQIAARRLWERELPVPAPGAAVWDVRASIAAFDEAARIAYDRSMREEGALAEALGRICHERVRRPDGTTFECGAWDGRRDHHDGCPKFDRAARAAESEYWKRFAGGDRATSPFPSRDLVEEEREALAVYRRTQGVACRTHGTKLPPLVRELRGYRALATAGARAGISADATRVRGVTFTDRFFIADIEHGNEVFCPACFSDANPVLRDLRAYDDAEFTGGSGPD